tara:strand:+ start:1865 stop:3139 length:1275 start_codon:yes stop_codon:yes gene_type:complete
MGTCVECTENSHCTVEGESCNPNSGECGDFTPCTPGDAGDAECAANGDGDDYCSEGGVCSECIVNEHCTTTGEGTCDETSFECRACEVGGSDCESGLCGTRDDGECVPDGDVIRVDGANTGGDVAGCGAVGSECATIGFAISQVDGTKNVIVVAAGTYDGALVFSDKSATLVANGEVVVKAGLPAEGDTVIDVAGTSEVVFDGITIEPAAAVAGTNLATCLGANASLSLLNSTIRNSQGLGIRSTCDLTITRSTISGNQGGGISVSGGNFNIVNNFIVYNGLNTSTAPGVSLSGNGTELTFDFNTVVGTTVANAGLTSGVSCALVSSPTGSGNIIYSGTPVGSAPVSGNCSWEYSNIEAVEPGEGNINMPPMLENNSALNGDYHLASGSPCINAADPAATLATDIDGEERPQGGRHDIGADEAE